MKTINIIYESTITGIKFFFKKSLIHLIKLMTSSLFKNRFIKENYLQINALSASNSRTKEKISSFINKNNLKLELKY